MPARGAGRLTNLPSPSGPGSSPNASSVHSASIMRAAFPESFLPPELVYSGGPRSSDDDPCRGLPGNGKGSPRWAEFCTTGKTREKSRWPCCTHSSSAMEQDAELFQMKSSENFASTPKRKGWRVLGSGLRELFELSNFSQGHPSDRRLSLRQTTPVGREKDATRSRTWLAAG